MFEKNVLWILTRPCKFMFYNICVPQERNMYVYAMFMQNTLPLMDQLSILHKRKPVPESDDRLEEPHFVRNRLSSILYCTIITH